MKFRKLLVSLTFLLSIWGCSEELDPREDTNKEDVKMERHSIYLGREPGESIQRFLWDIRSLSKSKDYDKVFDLFSAKYSDLISPEHFKNQLEKRAFEVVDSTILFMRTYETHGYAVVRLEYKSNNIIVTQFSVVFYRLEDGGWRVSNFPFMDTGVSEWGRIPNPP